MQNNTYDKLVEELINKKVNINKETLWDKINEIIKIKPKIFGFLEIDINKVYELFLKKKTK